MKEIIDKLDFIIMKNFCERQMQENWKISYRLKETFGNHIFDKEPVSRI